MDAFTRFVTDPKFLAYIVTTALAAVQVTATSTQIEMITGGLTAALMLIIHRVVKSKDELKS